MKKLKNILFLSILTTVTSMASASPYSDEQMQAMSDHSGIPVHELHALGQEMSLDEFYAAVAHQFIPKDVALDAEQLSQDYVLALALEEAAQAEARKLQEEEEHRLTLAFLEAEEREAVPHSVQVFTPYVLPSPSPSQVAPIAPTREAEEREFFDLTNVARQGQGLPALVWNGVLGTVAREHSQSMAQTFTFAHEIDGKSVGDRVQGRYNYSTVGENLFTSTASYEYSSHAGVDASSVQYASMQRAVDALMDSPGHRENILRPEFTELGVGIFTDESGGQKYWTQVFGRPFSQPLR